MADQEIRNSQASFSGVLIGALIAIATQIVLGLLGIAIGLVTFDPATGRWSGKWAAIGAGGWFTMALVVSFFIGGFVASRVSGQAAKSGAQWHGLGVWGLLEVAYLLFLGGALSSAGGLIARAGAGAAGAAGIAGSMDQVGQYLSKVRIVTDLSVMKGKAVTQFELPGTRDDAQSAGQKAGTVARKGKQEARKALKPVEQGTPEVREAAGEARKVASWITWPAFGAAVLGALSAFSGGLYGRTRTLRDARSSGPAVMSPRRT